MPPAAPSKYATPANSSTMDCSVCHPTGRLGNAAQILSVSCVNNRVWMQSARMVLVVTMAVVGLHTG